MTFGSLFSGIGGMDLGLERAGMQCRWQVEIEPYCQKVLTKHWPNVPKFGDIKQITGEELEPVDIIAGGFPCQDLSVAGKRAGIDGERSGLWSDFARLVGTLRPRFVLIENVPGLLANEPMRRVLGDLFALGFDAEWESIPAAAVGAPHLRDRVWIFAHSRQKHRTVQCQNGRSHDTRKRSDVFPERDVWGTSEQGKDWELVGMVPGVHQGVSTDWWFRQSVMARSVNGISRGLVDSANGGFGNAVVPQVAEWIGRRIIEAERVAK